MLTQAFRVSLATLLLCCPTALLSQDSAAQVDEIMKVWNSPGSPGAAITVVRAGRPVFQKGYGSANLEYGVAITPDTAFHMASVSKQFTAMAVILLEQDGKLSLGDDVRKYVPELPDYGHTVTIRDLLQHTSGIRDSWQALSLAGWGTGDVITQEHVMRVLYKQKELNFVPGDRFLYSNGAYTLAAEIVARVSGVSFARFCEELIFRPLGMTHTHFRDDHKRLVPNRSQSYSKTANGFEASPLNYATVGATGLFTTALDMSKWLINFHNPQVGGQAAVSLLTTESRLRDGSRTAYGLGLSVVRVNGTTAYSHPGSDAGYRTYMAYLPGEELAVVVMGNSDAFDAPATAGKIIASFLGERAKTVPPVVASPYRASDAETLSGYAGVYRINSGTRLEVLEQNGVLTAGSVGGSKSALTQTSENTFALGSAEARFRRSMDGEVYLNITQPNGVIRQGGRIRYAPFDATRMKDYVGRYWSDELEALYEIALVKDRLVATNVHHGTVLLTPVEKDWLMGNQWFMQEAGFVRDGQGRVTGVRIGAGGMKGILFYKN